MSTSDATHQVQATFSERIAKFLANPPKFISADEDEARERRMAEAELRERVRIAGIPSRFAAADIATCCEGAASFTETVLDGKFANLVLCGHSGTGKTHTACAVLIEFMRRRRRQGRFATVEGLLREVKATYEGHGSESDVLGKYIATPMLVMDEIGKEKATAWSLPIVEAVVNERYANLRPTVFTSQYRRDALAQRFAAVDGDGERAVAVVRRIIDRAVIAEAVRADG